MEQIIILLTTLIMSTGLFIFFVAKGGFNKKYLYTDNLSLALVSMVIIYAIYYAIPMPFWLLVPFISGFIVLGLFVLLFFYRFFPGKKCCPVNCQMFINRAFGLYLSLGLRKHNFIWRILSWLHFVPEIIQTSRCFRSKFHGY